MTKTKYIILAAVVVVGLVLAVQFVQISRYNRQISAFPDASVVGQGRPVLLEIGSSTCMYCRRMLPVLIELAGEEPKNFTVALVSLDRNPAAQKIYNVQAIPMQIFYDGQGRELYRHTGVLSREEILSRWLKLGVDGL